METGVKTLRVCLSSFRVFHLFCNRDLEKKYNWFSDSSDLFILGSPNLCSFIIISEMHFPMTVSIAWLLANILNKEHWTMCMFETYYFNFINHFPHTWKIDENDKYIISKKHHSDAIILMHITFTLKHKNMWKINISWYFIAHFIRQLYATTIKLIYLTFFFLNICS